jgi:outer membrane protein TolC
MRLPGGRALLAVLFFGLLGACAITPNPMDADARAKLASDTRREMFGGQDEVQGALTLSEAVARAIKYQAEHRQKQMEEAAAEAQLDVAKFDLLPKFTANAGYNWRNNESFGFAITPQGAISQTPSAAVERIYRTGGLGLAWNVLDFGVSYFRARQLADQKLIAEERRRKAVQTLMHDVRIAWWRAEAAERLLPPADRLLADIDQAIDKTRHIEARKLLPPVQIATLRRALLDLSQQIAFRRQDLAQSKIELAALINVPPGQELRIASPASDAREVLDLTADLDKLETLALESRPEIAEEGYRARISADEARKALVGLLPNVGFDFSRQWNSNKFLLNNFWTQFGATAALNLVKVASLPAMNRAEEAQKRADDARRYAMAIAVLTQTRIAGVRYMLVADEFLVWDEAARDDDLIVQYLSSSEKVGIDNELELIRARARAMASHMNRDLAYANLQASVARLFNSVGFDAVPRDDEKNELAQLTSKVDARLAELERAAFTQRAPHERVALIAGQVSGVEPRVAALLGEGVNRVLESAGMKASDPGASAAQLDLQVVVEKPVEGRRTASIAISTVPKGGSGPVFRRQFKTTLSQPVDDEQWRVLGEGAAYRVIGEISPARISRTTLRPAQTLNVPRPGAPRPGPVKFSEQSQPLVLRVEPRFGSALSEFIAVENRE